MTFTNLKAAQPKVYAKGPDVMSKSKWTQEQYWRQNRDQSSLTAFRFTANWAEIKSKVSNQPSILLNEPSDSAHSIVELLSSQFQVFLMLNLLLCCPIHFLMTNGMICFLKRLQKVTRLSGKLETWRMILKRNMSQSWRRQFKAPKMLSGTGLIFKKNQGSSCEAQK